MYTHIYIYICRERGNRGGRDVDLCSLSLPLEEPPSVLDGEFEDRDVLDFSAKGVMWSEL
jgi:hypothetical protein